MQADTLVTTFFHELAERRNRENDLSDLTWALCETLPGVARSLCRFFGLGAPDSSTIRIEREFDLGNGCRVDFAWLVSGRPRLFVENKIYDQDYHIHEYANQLVNFAEASLALLS